MLTGSPGEMIISACESRHALCAVSASPCPAVVRQTSWSNLIGSQNFIRHPSFAGSSGEKEGVDPKAGERVEHWRVDGIPIPDCNQSESIFASSPFLGEPVFGSEFRLHHLHSYSRSD